MRDILFRGKSIETDNWIEGSLIIREGKTYIDFHYKTLGDIYEPIEVHPKSVSQFLGIDLNDRKLFEGYILKFKHKHSSDWDIAEIMYFGIDSQPWSYPAFDLNGQNIVHNHFEGNAISEIFESEFDIEIIGHVFDDAHLLKIQPTI